MKPTTVLPIIETERTPIIDILRGWALLGVVLMNYVDYYYLGIELSKFKPADTLTAILMTTGNIVFSAKSWATLSFLFGYGFTTLIRNVNNKGINYYKFFSKRMFWLLIFGLLNSLFFFGDILKDYALMGIVLLLFSKASAKTAFVCSLSLLLIIAPVTGAYISSLHLPSNFATLEPLLPHLKSHSLFDVFYFQLKGNYNFEVKAVGYLVIVHLLMLALFLLGFAANKYQLFNKLSGKKRYIKLTFFSALVAAIFLNILFLIVEKFKWQIFKYYQPRFILVTVTMIFIISALSWLYTTGKCRAFFRSMQTIGRMTLTNYIIQNIVAFFLFSGFGMGLSLSNRIHFSYYLLFAITVYTMQVYFSKWWLSQYYYGPLEWVWRQLSYGKKIPLRKTGSQVQQHIVLPGTEPFVIPTN